MSALGVSSRLASGARASLTSIGTHARSSRSPTAISDFRSHAKSDLPHGAKRGPAPALSRLSRAGGSRKVPVRYTSSPGQCALLDDALRAQRAGRAEAAIALYTRCIEIEPERVDAWMNLGALEARAGRAAEAALAFERAATLAPGNGRVLRDIGIGLKGVGRLAEASAALEGAVAREPALVGAWLHLAQLRLELGELAADAARRAVELRPDNASVHFSLARAVFDDARRDPALESLARATQLGHAEAPVFHWLLGGRERRSSPAASAPATPALEALADAAHYVREHMTAARLFASARETLRFAAARAPRTGDVVELGVFHGVSLRWLVELKPGRVHGFDSFEGLPSAWHPVPEGTFTTAGRTPEGIDCRYWVGPFAEQLPRYLQAHEQPLALLHVDSDLYESAKCGLTHLAPRLLPGAVIVFDEYFGHKSWRQDEYRAFREAVAREGWRYEYLAANPFTGQVVVRLW